MIDEIIARREAFLSGYQNAAYAKRYRSLVEKVRAAEEKAAPGSNAVTEAVARNLFKAMAIKDEYEVARLYTDGTFEKKLRETFHGGKINFLMAPPLIAIAVFAASPVATSASGSAMTYTQ